MKQLILTSFMLLYALVSGAEEAMIAVEPLDADSIQKREQTIGKIEKYLNSFDYFSANFEQYSPGQPFAKGEFKLKKPGKFLWLYQEPESYKIVSTGNKIYFVDEGNGQVTELPRHPALEELLLKKDIHLKDTQKLQIQNIVEDDASIDLFLKMENNGEPLQLAMNFSKAPFELKEILTTDQLGRKVYLTLKGVDHKTKLANKLFEYKPPQYQENEDVW